MTLLEDVIAEAHGAGSVPPLLRKLATLAKRTRSTELLRWVNLELNGYPRALAVPPYRGPFYLPPFGYFVRGAQREKNVQISRLDFPKELQNGEMFSIELHHPIAAIETFADQPSQNFPWSAEEVDWYNLLVANKEVNPVKPGLTLVSVARPADRHIFVGVLDQIRNKALDLALELEAITPDAGEKDVPEATNSEIRQSVTNYNFYGADFSGSNNALGSSGFEQDQTPRD